MIQSIKDGREEDGNRSIADKIIKRLHELEKTIENNQARWAWELLQNAKDSVAEEPNRTVSVQIQLNENSLEFKHNGAHFTEQDVRGLINQISSKEMEEGQQTKKTGRFGTGFLTTHLLSRLVQVKGIIETKTNDFYTFEFPLDRRSGVTSQLIPKINNSWSKFDESLIKIDSNHNKSEFNTSFCYQLETEEQRKISKIGIEEFLKLVPFVLVFIPKIIKVEIIDNTTKNSFIFQNNQELRDNLVVPIVKTENEKKTNVLILCAFDDKVMIATEVEETGRGYSVKSIKNIPKLFCDFPLIGTEDFHFPVIINSFFFNPKAERDGIWLRGNDDAEVKENRKLLENAIKLYKNLIPQITEKRFFDLYNIAETKIPFVNEKYPDEKLFLTSIQTRLRQIVKESKVIETEDGKTLFDDVYFPDPALTKEDREKIWKLSSDLKVNKLPLKQHIHEWAELIWKGCKKVDIDDLVVDLKGKANIAELIRTLEVDKNQSLTWLNNCIEFIYKVGGQNQFDSNNLIPNQEGLFKNRKELSADAIEDETLKEVAFLLGHNYYNKLIHQDIYFEGDSNITTLQSIANLITKELMRNDDNNDRKRRLSIIKLVEWFEHNPEKAEEFFGDLYRSKEKLFVDTIEDKDNLYLVLKSEIPLSKLASPELVEEIRKAKELTDLLEEFGANSVPDLKRKMELAQNITTDNSKILITQETLASLGVTSVKELEEALKDTTFASQFTHTSIPTIEMFTYAQELIGRAKANVIDYLKTHPDYDCSEWEELATTVIGGIKKEGIPVYIVVRPSDNEEVIIHYSSEKDTLDNSNAELWIDNGVDNPKHLTLGRVLKATGINRILV